MEKFTGYLYIAGILVIVLLLGSYKKHAEWVVNFLLRGITGMLLIYFINFLLSKQLPEIGMGYNALTFLASAALGFPGVLMLYGINLYMLL